MSGRKYEMPNDLYGRPNGLGHDIAMDRILDIAPYIARASAHLAQARDESLPPAVRGGYLRDAWGTLDTIIGLSTSAKQHLIETYDPD